MKSIIHEIIDYKTSEEIAGRNPIEITLSGDQCRRLKEWCDSHAMVWSAPDGAKRLVPGLAPEVFNGGMILGMRFTCPE